MVILAAVSFFITGSRTYTSGSGQASVQRNVRVTAEYIISEIRSKKELVFKENQTPATTPVPISGDTAGYRGFRLEGNVFRGFDNDKPGVTAPNLKLISDVVFSLSKLTDTNNYVLHFTVKGLTDAGGQKFELKKELLLINSKLVTVTGALNTDYSLKTHTLFYKKN